MNAKTLLLPALALLLLLSCGDDDAPAREKPGSAPPAKATSPAGDAPPAGAASRLPPLEEAPEPHVVRPGIMGARGWYPGDAETLAKSVDAALDAAPEWKGAKPIALVVPHAGHRFAGREQGKAFRTIQGRTYRRVFVFGVNHRRTTVDGISVPAYTHYETPLGRIPCDRAAMDRLLAAGPPFKDVTAAHREEHSIEILLPYLQRAIGSFFLVPMIVRASPDQIDAAAKVLRKEIGPGDLLVASSDFTHYGDDYRYHPFPPDEHVAENLRALDMGAAARVLGMDRAGFARYRERTGITVCGFHPICLLLSLLPKGAMPVLTGYDTSARLTGSYRSCVSYVGMAFLPPLSAEDEKLGLRIARESMTRMVEKKERFDPVAEGWEVPETMRHDSGVFVTLKIGEVLRGCIGDIFAQRPLYEAIAARAISSAVEDPRFPPVRPDELPKITIEVSVLSPLRPVAKPQDIEIGKHGILLSYDGRRRSVYLPQVAPEQGWGLEETLSHLSMKGGLPATAWKTPGASFEVFTAQVFGEHE